MSRPTAERQGIAEWPLTGRDAEVGAVTAALASGRGIVLAGPSGVGKTRLLAECLGRLPAGTAPMRFIATEVTGRLPFGALATLLPAGVVFGRERVDLFRAVAAELAAAGAGRRLVVAVDDAHLLDDAGLALLHHLVQEDVVTAALTVRSQRSGLETLSPADTVGVGGGVAATGRATGLAWHDVPTLTRPDMAALLAAVLGAPVERDTTVLLDEYCGGDLVLLHELLLHARGSGQLVRQGGVWRLDGPPQVGRQLARMVDDRVRTLPAAIQAAVEAVAVTEPLQVSVLERIASVEAVVVAERAGLVRVDERDGRAVARCAHPVYAEVFRRQVPALRRADLWRAVAVALLALPAVAPDDELRVASWWLDSATVRDATTGVDAELLLRAARRAAALLDHRLARRLALASAEQRTTADALRTAAEESLWLGETERADALLRRSLREAADEGERTTIITSLAGAQLFGAGRIAAALAILDQGPPTPPAIALRAAALMQRGDVAAADRVLGPTWAGGDLIEEAVVTAARGAVDISAGRPAVAARRCAELRGRSRDDARAPLVEHLLASTHRTALHLSGSFDEAERLIVAAHEDATRQAADERRAITALELGRMRRDRGNLPGAVAALTEATTILLRTPTGFGPSALNMGLGMLAATYAKLGDLDAARAVRARADLPLLSELDPSVMQFAEAHLPRPPVTSPRHWRSPPRRCATPGSAAAA